MTDTDLAGCRSRGRSSSSSFDRNHPRPHQTRPSHRNGVFGVISGVCNHAGGPLGQGRLDGNYVVCHWHNWKFHRVTGIGEPGSEDDAVPSYK